MQQSIWLLAFLPHLHQFGSLVHGATVLTSPTNLIRIQQPQSLNSSNGLPTGLNIIDKERGPELSGTKVFETGLLVIAAYLANEEFFEFMQPEAWHWNGTVIGVSVNSPERENKVQRAFVIQGIYLIFLLMKDAKDFRSGIFTINYGGFDACNMTIFSTDQSPGLTDPPSFSHMTELAPPSASLADNANGSPQSNASALWPIFDLRLRVNRLDSFPWLDRLGLLLGLVNVLLTSAEPSATDRVKGNIEITTPFSGVKTSIYPVLDAPPRDAMVYEDINFAVSSFFGTLIYEGPTSPGFLAKLFYITTYIGDIVIGPSNFSAPTSRLAGANADASAGTATSRKRGLSS